MVLNILLQILSLDKQKIRKYYYWLCMEIPCTEFINGNRSQASNSSHWSRDLLLKGTVFNNLISRNRFKQFKGFDILQLTK